MVIGVLIATAISFLFGYIAQAIFNWFNGVYDVMFWNAFAIEINFRGLSNFSISGIYNAVYTFAIAVLIMLFVKKMIEVYMAWSNGAPEVSPMTVVIGFVKALIIMICFGFIYTQFAWICYDLYQSIFIGMLGDFQTMGVTIGNMAWNILGAFFYLIIAIYMVLIYFQTLTRGIEMFILRLAIPIACIGLLNSDGGAFNGYVKKFISNAFTVIVQLTLLQFSILLMNNAHIILSLSAVMIANRTPHLLREFMETAGGNSSLGSKVSTATRTVSSFKNIISKGR